MPSRRYLVALLILLVAGTAIWVWWPTDHEPPQSVVATRELDRKELVLRDGRLYVEKETTPFTGVLVERFGGGEIKLSIEIDKGKVHGRSIGYFESGQIEVEEFFIEGVSHGKRTRRYPDGAMKSEEIIVDGTLNGPYVQWHENGQKALEMTLLGGQPDGKALAWHPDGSLKSQTTFAMGTIVEQKFYTAEGEE